MIIFLHIPKTAGTSFNFILENSLGASYCHTNHTKRETFTQDGLDFAKKVFPALRAVGGHNLVDPMSLSARNPFHMTFLREPVSRALSQYQERVIINRRQGRPVLELEEALRTAGEMENLHVKLMAGGRNLDKAKRYLETCAFVGLTEKFDLSLHALGKICPEKLNLHYQKRRVQPDNSIRKKLEADSRLMDMVREYNKLDIELYEFAVKEIFPKLCGKAGLNPADKIASLDSYKSDGTFNIRLSRFYNLMIYRQLCKWRR
jgi:Sulfotransferase family